MAYVFSAVSALTETLGLLTDVAVLIIGIQTIRTGLDVLDRLIKGWLWLAGLVQLVFCLACSLIGDLAPIIGHHLGKLAGRTYRLGIQCRILWASYGQPVAIWADYESRRFVECQFGDHFLADWASPYCLVIRDAFPGLLEPSEGTFEMPSLTRRELLALAKAQGLPGYSRLKTEELRLALA